MIRISPSSPFFLFPTSTCSPFSWLFSWSRDSPASKKEREKGERSNACRFCSSAGVVCLCLCQNLLESHIVFSSHMYLSRKPVEHRSLSLSPSLSKRVQGKGAAFSLTAHWHEKILWNCEARQRERGELFFYIFTRSSENNLHPAPVIESCEKSTCTRPQKAQLVKENAPRRKRNTTDVSSSHSLSLFLCAWFFKVRGEVSTPSSTAIAQINWFNVFGENRIFTFR